MKIRSVQGLAGGTGVTSLAAELALTGEREGRTVVVLDLSPNRCLHEKLIDESFHYLGDVRDLFCDPARLRLTDRKMPIQGLFSYPSHHPFSLTKNANGALEMVFEPALQTGPDAYHHLVATCQTLAAFYDEMIIDVPVTNWALMSLVSRISDEVHLVLAHRPARVLGSDDWHAKVNLVEAAKVYPKIITHSDRSRPLAA